MKMLTQQSRKQMTKKRPQSLLDIAAFLFVNKTSYKTDYKTSYKLIRN